MEIGTTVMESVDKEEAPRKCEQLLSWAILSNDISPDCFHSWILIVRTVSLGVGAYLVSHVTPIQIGLRQRGECRQGLIAAIIMFSNALMGRDSGL